MYQLFQQRRHRHPPVRITRDMKEKRGGSCPLSPVRAVFRIVCRDSRFTFLMLLFLPHCTDFLFQELKPGAGKEQSPDPPKQRSVLQGVDTQLTCHRNRWKRTDPPSPGARRLGRPRLHGQQHLLGRLPHKTSHSYLLGTLSPSRVSQASKGQLCCSTCQDQNPSTIADLLASVQSTQKPSHPVNCWRKYFQNPPTPLYSSYDPFLSSLRWVAARDCPSANFTPPIHSPLKAKAKLGHASTNNPSPQSPHVSLKVKYPNCPHSLHPPSLLQCCL